MLTAGRFDAVLFDLDGVLTETATLHAAAWKQMFDTFLRHRAETRGEPLEPFDIDDDYRWYVDGKPRYDGVRERYLQSYEEQMRSERSKRHHHHANGAASPPAAGGEI